MRSCDSESITSSGVMPSSRRGTRSTNRSTPFPARCAISATLEESPAAPMSWTPATRPLSIASRQASRSSFSRNGSPTWTAGLSASEASERSAEANTAPPNPSRPVFEPT